jgi:hypothetical protein
MVNPVVAPMVVAAKIKKYYRRFEEAGATNPESAKTLQSLGLHGGFLFNRLIRNGVFVETGGERYYVISEKYRSFKIQRRKKAMMIMGIIILVFLAVSYFIQYSE